MAERDQQKRREEAIRQLMFKSYNEGATERRRQNPGKLDDCKKEFNNCVIPNTIVSYSCVPFRVLEELKSALKKETGDNIPHVQVDELFTVAKSISKISLPIITPGKKVPGPVKYVEKSLVKGTILKKVQEFTDTQMMCELVSEPARYQGNDQMYSGSNEVTYGRFLVQKSFLDHEPKNVNDWSIGEVANHCIKPTVQDPSEAGEYVTYHDYLRQFKVNGESIVKDPFDEGMNDVKKFYVIAPRQSNFFRLVEALKKFFDDYNKNDPGSISDPYIWVDILATNHAKRNLLRATETDGTVIDERLNLVQSMSARAVGVFSHILLYIDDWKNPVFLRRSWCMFELYWAIKYDQSISFVFTDEDLGEKLLKMLPALESDFVTYRDSEDDFYSLLSNFDLATLSSKNSVDDQVIKTILGKEMEKDAEAIVETIKPALFKLVSKIAHDLVLELLAMDTVKSVTIAVNSLRIFALLFRWTNELRMAKVVLKRALDIMDKYRPKLPAQDSLEEQKRVIEVMRQEIFISLDRARVYLAHATDSAIKKAKKKVDAAQMLLVKYKSNLRQLKLEVILIDEATRAGLEDVNAMHAAVRKAKFEEPKALTAIFNDRRFIDNVSIDNIIPRIQERLTEDWKADKARVVVESEVFHVKGLCFYHDVRLGFFSNAEEKSFAIIQLTRNMRQGIKVVMQSGWALADREIMLRMDLAYYLANRLIGEYGMAELEQKLAMKKLQQAEEYGQNNASLIQRKDYLLAKIDYVKANNRFYLGYYDFALVSFISALNHLKSVQESAKKGHSNSTLGNQLFCKSLEKVSKCQEKQGNVTFFNTKNELLELQKKRFGEDSWQVKKLKDELQYDISRQRPVSSMKP